MERTVAPSMIAGYRSVPAHGARGKEGGREAAGGRGLGWCEAERAAAQHGGRQAVHNWLRLHVQVAIHLVRTPSSNATDAVAVNAGAKK